MIATNAVGGALSAGFITRLQSNVESPDIVFRFQIDSATNLNEDLDAVESGVDVVDNSVFSDLDIIQIDNEFMLITDANPGPNTLTVTRGYKWNPAATHSNGTDIFLFNEHDVMSVSDLSIDPDLGSSECVVTVSNADQAWNIFLSDLTNHGNAGTIELEFAGLVESITLFSGVADHVEFDSDNMQASIYLVDRLAKILDQEINPTPTDQEFPTTNHPTNPLDWIWDLLTDEAGLDDTASTDNIDIDYASWDAVKTKVATKNSNMDMRLPRFHTYRSAIQLILYMWSCQAFITHEGKLGFAYMLNDAGAGDDTWADAQILRTVNGSPIDGNRVYTDLSELVNSLQTFFDYDFSANRTWGGSHTQTDATSIADYGISKLVEENNIIWHEAIASAQGAMDWQEAIHKDPKIFSVLTTYLYGIRSEIGDTIDLSDADYGFANKLMKIDKILRIDMDNFTITVLLRA